MYDGMGRTGAEDRLQTCDGCDSTVTCADTELSQWGWVRKGGKNKNKKAWLLVLCDGCKPK